MSETENRRPLVSVIIPAYNAEQFISKTLESVFAQTYENLQVIVVDDASTDSTPDILKNFDDPRLQIITKAENKHLIAARNTAFGHVKGEYVAFVDADDVWQPEKIEKQVAFLENDRTYGACFTWGSIIDENGDPRQADTEDVRWLERAFHEENRSRSQWMLRLLTGGNSFLCSSAMVRTEIIRKVGKQNITLLQLQDFEYWIRVLSVSQIHILCEELVQYRRVRENTSISAVSEDSRNRTRNEDVYICTRFFDYISDEEFSTLFRDHFRNKDANGAAELACEKAFLLRRAYCDQEPMLAKLQELISKEETAKVLAEKYGYTHKQFYADNVQGRYVDNGVRQDLMNKQAHITLLINEEQQLHQKLDCTEGECKQLRAKENELKNEIEAMKNSRTWRVGSIFTKAVRFFIPVGSKRALLCRLLWTCVRHPGKILKNLKPQKLKKLFRFLSRGDFAGVKLLIESGITGQPAPSSFHIVAPNIVQVDPDPKGKKKASDYPVLTVPQWEKPKVSIVIPVYNQFAYTYHCVASILKHSGDVSYEIIIANDCSTDLTTQIDKILPGVKCVTNEKNLRFLLNCNNAAKHARGEHILFLNNDTQVLENCLAPLVELIERSDDIGMVGAKLIYPDGTLQEAGGILWKDGSAWNFGNRQNPQEPQFNYVKEADYISGAAIMIRKSLWEQIGGFDERFVPAYYEDTDLAFEVRNHGYKVMYQPLSVVVHFEGKSNGTDTSSGLKAYQVANQKKFFEKWQAVLEAEHFENGQQVFSARDRSARKETVLVIDHYIPTYDKDAGSRSVDHYLRLLVAMGLNVKFLGDNFYHDEHYAKRYEQMGIEILSGVYYRDNWKQWVVDNAQRLDYVLLSRPHISIKYIDFLREKTNAKIVYYVQDLHFLREEREYEFTHNPELLVTSKQVKAQEMYIMGRSDTVFTLSQVEKDIIDAEVARDRAVITPISYFESFPDTRVDVSGKKDIIFVGGFGHRPNEDGIMWFMNEVWQKVSAAIPDCRLIIIGSKPTDQIKALQSDKVVVTGFVSDEELEAHYEQARICIIPLRYGAGVKGKTIEAMYHRVPIVSTSVGIEGLAGIEEYVAPADDAASFGDSVIRFWNDPQNAARVAEGYFEYLKAHMSFESALALFKGVFKKD